MYKPREKYGSVSHYVVFTADSSKATSDSGFAYADGKPMGCDQENHTGAAVELK